MVSIEITNYESIRHTKLEVEGFTTLVGLNGLGKSAVLRAVNAALINQQGNHFISWGENHCEVHIKTKNLDLVWHKEEGNNFYIINGQTYSKIGKEPPPAPVAAAGFKLLKIGTEKVNLNYSVQFFPLFLVDRQDSKGADLITSVYGLDRIYKAVDLCNRAQRTNKDTTRLREKDLELVEKGLEVFKDFEKTKELIAHLKAKKIETEKAEKQLATMRVWRQRVLELNNRCKELRNAAQTKLPATMRINNIVADFNVVLQMGDKLDELKAALSALKPLLSYELPTVATDAIKGKFKDLEKVRGWHKELEWSAPRARKLKAAAETVLPEAPEDIHKIISIKKLYRDFNEVRKDTALLKAELDTATQGIAALQEEKAKYDACPVCARPWDN